MPTLRQEFLYSTTVVRNFDNDDLCWFEEMLELTEIDNGQRWWLAKKLPIHRQAFINRHAEYCALMEERALLPISEFMKQEAVFEQKKAAFFAKYDVRNQRSLAWFYDYYGKLMIATNSGPGFESYIARLHETTVHLQLVRAQAEIRLAALPADRVPDFLATRLKLFNPYTGQPFSWDAEKRTLSFVAQAAGGGRLIIKKDESYFVQLPQLGAHRSQQL